jgi:hypothetical protein
MSNKPHQLRRVAIWSAGLTVGIPLIWAALASMHGSTGLGIGWYGVLPMMFFVPIGAVVTLALFIAAGIAAANARKAARSQDGKAESIASVAMHRQQDPDSNSGRK